MHEKWSTNIEWQMVDSLAKLISGPDSCNLFQNEGSAMLVLVVGVEMNISRLPLIKLAAHVSFLASFLHVSIIDTLNSIID